MTTRQRHHPNQAKKTTFKHKTIQPARPEPALMSRPADAALLQQARTNPNVLPPDGVLRLQRTMGNQAVRRILTHTSGRPHSSRNWSLHKPTTAPTHSGSNHHKAIQRFAYNDNPVDWTGLGRFWKLPGGRRGVYQAEKGEEKIIVKLDNEAGTGDNELANTLIQEGMGLQVPGVRAVFPTNPEWNIIMGTARDWASQPVNQGTRIVQDYENDIATTQVILLMNELRGVSFLDLVLKPENHPTLFAALANPNVLAGIGKLLVIDGFLRNDDRLEGPFKTTNLGNFMLSEDGNQIITLDSHVTHLEKVVKTQTERGDLNQIGSNVTFLREAFDDTEVNRILGTHFRNTIEEFFVEKTGRKPTEAEVNWDQVREGVMVGVIEARQTLYQRLQERKTQIKQEFNRIKTDYNTDEDRLDWTTYKMRLTYLKARTEGQDPENGKIIAYVYLNYKRWQAQYDAQINQITTIDPSLLEVPEKPQDMTFKEKTMRLFKGNSKKKSKDKEIAKKVKEKVRKGKDVDSELEAKLRLGGDDRRIQKALYLLQFDKFSQALSDRVDLIGKLQQEAHQSINEAAGEGAPAALARRKLKYMRKSLEGQVGQALFQVYTNMATTKGKWLKDLTEEEQQSLTNECDGFLNLLNQLYEEIYNAPTYDNQ